MVQNVCSTADRTFRIVVGLALLSLLFLLNGSWAYLGLFGIVPLVTVVIRYCPISHMLGISTCSLKHSHS